MSDEKNTRAAIDRMAQRIRKEHQRSGSNLSSDAARKQAVDIAKRYDRKYRK